MKSLTTKIISQVDNSLIVEWQNLWDTSEYSSIINGPQWFQAVRSSFPTIPHVAVAIYNKAKLVGITAMFHMKVMGILVYTIPPNDVVTGIPFLAESDNRELIYSVLHDELKKIGTVMLDNIPDYFLPVFSRTKKSNLYIPQALNYYLDITRDEKGLVIIPGRKKLFHEAKRVAQFYEITPYNGKEPKALDIAFHIDDISSKQSDGYATFSDIELKKFYRHLQQYFGENFITSILYFNKKPVAYEIGFRNKHEYTGSQVAYDKRYAQYTPGKMSELAVVDALANKGIKRVDYGSGDSYIKRLICDKKRQLYTVVISHNRLLSFYIKTVLNFKNYIFHLLSENKALYIRYKKLHHALLQ